MINLFIDTSNDELIIAILKDDVILAKKSKKCRNEHSVYTVKYIDDVLKELGLEPNDVDNIMVVTGPGSFTGLRIGVSVAKTYAYLLGKRIIPVSSLRSMALSTDNNIAICLIDAKNNNYYVGIYDMFDNSVTYETFTTKEDVLEKIKKYKDANVVSNKEFYIDDIKIKKVELDIENIVRVYSKEKDVVNVHDVKPNYLKLPQVYEKNNG